MRTGGPTIDAPGYPYSGKVGASVVPRAWTTDEMELVLYMGPGASVIGGAKRTLYRFRHVGTDFRKRFGPEAASVVLAH
jgi:hypothetical protein